MAEPRISCERSKELMDEGLEAVSTFEAAYDLPGDMGLQIFVALCFLRGVCPGCYAASIEARRMGECKNARPC